MTTRSRRSRARNRIIPLVQARLPARVAPSGQPAASYRLRARRSGRDADVTAGPAQAPGDGLPVVAVAADGGLVEPGVALAVLAPGEPAERAGLVVGAGVERRVRVGPGGGRLQDVAVVDPADAADVSAAGGDVVLVVAAGRHAADGDGVDAGVDRGVDVGAADGRPGAGARGGDVRVVVVSLLGRGGRLLGDDGRLPREGGRLLRDSLSGQRELAQRARRREVAGAGGDAAGD